MNLPSDPRPRRLFTCPHCTRPVILTERTRVLTTTGETAVALDPLVHALAIHMRVGCEAT